MNLPDFRREEKKKKKTYERRDKTLLIGLNILWVLFISYFPHWDKAHSEAAARTAGWSYNEMFSSTKQYESDLLERTSRCLTILE